MNSLIPPHLLASGVWLRAAAHPGAVIQDALLAAALLACFALLLGAKREIRREAHRHRRALEQLAAKLAERISEHPSALVLSPDSPALALPQDSPVPQQAPPPLIRSGMNLNWRVQARRLLRRGHDVAHVSAAVGVPRREIELLIRVHQLASARLPERGAVKAAGA